MLNPTKLGIAGGILWSLSLFFLTLIAMHTGYPAQFLNSLVSIYPGYSISGLGSVIGLIYGFVDAFVSLFLLAWIYDKLLSR